MKKLYLTLVTMLSFTLLYGGEKVTTLPPEFQIPPHESMEQVRIYTEFDQVLLLLQKWLASMHELARLKWNYGLPAVADTHTTMAESRLLAMAKSAGLPQEWSEKMVYAHVCVANKIISRDFEQWKESGAGYFLYYSSMLDLQAYIDELTCAMYNKIATILHLFEEGPCSCEFFQQPLSRRPYDRVSAHLWREAVAPFCEFVEPLIGE